MMTTTYVNYLYNYLCKLIGIIRKKVIPVTKDSFTEDIVYSFVCKHPGLCTYEISKRLGMTGGRVRHALSKLQKNGLVKFKFEKKNPRIKKLTYPIDTWNLLPKKLRQELRISIKKGLLQKL